MIILDLGAGLGGEQRREEVEAMGHVYHTLDINPEFNCTFTADVMDFWPEINYDLIWGSPPCTYFTVMQVGRNWNKDHTPKTDNAKNAIPLTKRFIEICRTAPMWAIENPRAKLRKLDFMQEYERWTVSYCHYGEDRMKPTDIWGVLPGWIPRPMCHNQGQDHPLDCCCRDHVNAVRGSTTGTQGRLAEESAIVPLELWKEILNSIDP